MATTNTLFALFAVSSPQKIADRLTLTSKIPIRSMKTSGDSWFLIAPASTTTIELSGDLGITDGTNGSGILVRAENYYGRTNKDVWEWVAAKMGEPLDTGN